MVSFIFVIKWLGIAVLAFFGFYLLLVFISSVWTRTSLETTRRFYNDTADRKRKT